MEKKFVILIEDDFEIMGNGLGNVASLQYLPAHLLMNIAEEMGVKVTFMVDVAHRLFLRKYENICPNIRIQARIWDETVVMMKERGFDVQLHLHPQWLDATYNTSDGYFYLGKKWNIGCYAPPEQKKLISESIEYLKSLLNPVSPDYNVIAFKAGSWGLQPSESLLKILSDHGIQIIVGVREGLKIPAASIDYENLEEKALPYHPDINDITRIARSRNGMAVLLLQPFAPGMFTLLRLILNRGIKKMLHRNNLFYYHKVPIPRTIHKLSPLAGKSNLRLAAKPYLTHLKIGNLPFSYLKTSFDSVIKRMRCHDMHNIPIVIESHTKQYNNYYHDVKKFMFYMMKRYSPEVEFSDFTSYAKKIAKNPSLVKIKHENQ